MQGTHHIARDPNSVPRQHLWCSDFLYARCLIVFRGGNKNENDSTPLCPETTGLTLKEELVREMEEEVGESTKQMQLISS